MLNPSLVTGLILAGGRGSRMGNTDKGLQVLDGLPMIAHVINRLSPQVGKLMINANRNLDRYAGFGLPVFPDDLADYAGPLAGLQVGMRHCDTPYLVTAPCDSPFLPNDLVARLGNALLEADADLAVAVTGTGEHRQPHPVFCLMKSALLPALNDYLRQGRRRIDGWYAPLNVVEVDFDDDASFRNINTFEELQESASN